MSEKYELIVIGAGPGGYIAAIEAANFGKKVAIIEKEEVGGTCLNHGCIPTKTLIHTTDVLAEVKNANHIGISINEFTIDLERIHQHKEEVVLKLREGIKGLLKKNKIDLITGTATIVTENSILVDDTIYETDYILIATGSKPSLPPITGINNSNVITSNELLATSNEPYHQLVIIGGGVIGVEFATIYNALGCEVTIIEAESRLLPTLDKEIGQNLSMILKKRGVKIYTNAYVEKIEGTDKIKSSDKILGSEKIKDSEEIKSFDKILGTDKINGSEKVTCYFTSKDKMESIETEKILVAVGRCANIVHLLGEDFQLKIDRGMIVVNENFETSIKGIYAIGDVIKGGIQLAHVASSQGMNVAALICDKTPFIDLSIVPACIYTSPEIATVGITIEEVKALAIPIETAKYVMSSNAKSIITSADRGFIKIIVHEETKVILGAIMMCSRATDMIGEFSTAIVNKLTIKDLAAVIRPHPTYCEGISEVVYQVLHQ